MVEITTIFSKIIISIRVFGYHSTYAPLKTPSYKPRYDFPARSAQKRKPLQLFI